MILLIIGSSTYLIKMREEKKKWESKKKIIKERERERMQHYL